MGQPLSGSLTGGPSADSLEREAAAVAEASMDRPELSLGRPGPAGPIGSAARSAADGPLRTAASPLRGGGEPLDGGVRQLMQTRFGFDFAGVRIHRGRTAVGATTALNARAVTIGSDIAFAPGEFCPHTTSGQRLLAHELTHVAQQRTRSGAPAVQRQPKPAQDPWLTQLDDILPRNVGLVVHMNRIGQLTDRFSTDELNDLIGLIHANADATTFTLKEAGVPGIFALQDTRVGKRLDVGAARLLLTRFPVRPVAASAGEGDPAKVGATADKSKHVFSDDVVRDAYLKFHFNAILPGKDDPVPPDLPAQVRQNCIAIVHSLAPKLFSSESVVKKIEQRFAQLRKQSVTHTMVHTGDALAGVGVSDPRTVIKFADAAGKKTNGDTEPVSLGASAWDAVMNLVGTEYGWHIFGMAIMDGHHSVTLFVDNQPGGKELYWADQWRIDSGDDFFQQPGAVSGFRQYQKAGFDRFIETMTNRWWNDVHRPDSKCGKAKGAKWDSGCRYSATLMLWHLRKVVQQ